MKKILSLLKKLDATTISVYICGLLGVITYIIANYVEYPVNL